MKNRTLAPGGIGLLLSLSLSAAPLPAAEIGDTTKPIRLSVQEWTAQNVSVHIVGRMLEEMGYDAEYVTIGTVPGFQALADGDIDVTVETWLQTDYALLKEAMDDGRILDLGDVGINAIQTWFYPAYMEATCPELPDWQALTACVDQFVTAETLGRGRLLDYPADWPTNNAERVAALGLEYEVINAGSEGALIAEIKSAFERSQPLLVQFWAPHWIFSSYDLKPLLLPPYEEGCFENPEVGINKKATFDCDWNNLRVLKTANAQSRETWPAAIALISGYSFTNEDQAQMMQSVDVEGLSVEVAAEKWMAENEDRWRSWIAAATAP